MDRVTRASLVGEGPSQASSYYAVGAGFIGCDRWLAAGLLLDSPAKPTGAGGETGPLCVTTTTRAARWDEEEKGVERKIGFHGLLEC